MSWSLEIENGDLQFGSAGLNVVTGSQKLTQDLACDLLEPMGTDPLHPSFGSVIDGGYDTNGNYVQGVIGQSNDASTGSAVGNEVSRICQNYQTQQIARNQADVATYAKSTLTADEALLAVMGIQVEQVQDQALVTATLQTGAGGLPLTLPFTAS
jgi:hypothetical protein